MTTCPACNGAHDIQRCPAVWALLRAPEACTSCGDPIDQLGICPACREYEAHEQLTADQAIIAGMVRDDYGISLALRAACRETSEARVDGIPF